MGQNHVGRSVVGRTESTVTIEQGVKLIPAKLFVLLLQILEVGSISVKPLAQKVILHAAGW